MLRRIHQHFLSLCQAQDGGCPGPCPRCGGMCHYHRLYAAAWAARTDAWTADQLARFRYQEAA